MHQPHCTHTETTRHFVWTCTGPAGHPGHTHLLRPAPVEDAA